MLLGLAPPFGEGLPVVTGMAIWLLLLLGDLVDGQESSGVASHLNSVEVHRERGSSVLLLEPFRSSVVFLLVAVVRLALSPVSWPDRRCAGRQVTTKRRGIWRGQRSSAAPPPPP